METSDNPDISISLTDPMFLYSSGEGTAQIDKVIIGASVKELGNLGILCSELVLKEGVKTLGSGCFIISSLLPNFAENPRYDDIEIPASVENFSPYAISSHHTSGRLIFKDSDKPLNIVGKPYSGYDDYKSSIKELYLGRTLSETSATFDSYVALQKAIVGENVTSITAGTFKNCTALTNVIIPASVETIGAEAFSGCTNFDVITLPETLKFIGSNAYASCDNVTRVVARGTVPAEGVEGESVAIGDNLYEKAPLYVPAAAYDDYANAELFWDWDFEGYLFTHEGNVVQAVSTEEVEEGNFEILEEKLDGKPGDQISILDLVNINWSKNAPEIPAAAARKAPRKAAKAGDDVPVYWYSTGSGASVDENGKVTINNDRPAEIWAIALDGSDKKVVFSLNNPYTLGDLNNDGVIDVVDLNLLNDSVAGLSTDVKIRKNAADMNGDDDIDITDLNILSNMISNEENK